MTDSNDLLLMGVGILIGLAVVTVFLLIQKQPLLPIATSSYGQPSYVPIPESIRR